MDMALLAGLSTGAAEDGLFCRLPLINQWLNLNQLAVYNLGWPLLAHLSDVVPPSRNVGCKGLLEVSGPIPLLKAGLSPKQDRVHAVRL